MHDQDFCALLETPELLRQALDVHGYVTAFRDEVPGRFLDLLAAAMRDVEGDMLGWHLHEDKRNQQHYYQASRKLKRLADLEVCLSVGIDRPGDVTDITFIAPSWAVWTRTNIQFSRRGRLKEAVAALIPDMRDNEDDVPAWGRPEGWPMPDEASEILAVTGDAGRELARAMAARVVALKHALEAAADRI